MKDKPEGGWTLEEWDLFTCQADRSYNAFLKGTRATGDLNVVHYQWLKYLIESPDQLGEIHQSVIAAIEAWFQEPSK